MVFFQLSIALLTHVQRQHVHTDPTFIHVLQTELHVFQTIVEDVMPYFTTLTEILWMNVQVRINGLLFADN